MTRQDWADVALVVALGAAMLGSCALLRAALPTARSSSRR